MSLPWMVLNQEIVVYLDLSLLIEEEVPENIGHEWRFQHPFELPGVRFPTDTTPPNQRRLAENDGLSRTYTNY